MDTLYYLFGTLIFIAVVLFIEGAYLTWNSSKGPEASRIARRLRIMSAGAHAGDSDVSILYKYRRFLGLLDKFKIAEPAASEVRLALEELGRNAIEIAEDAERCMAREGEPVLGRCPRLCSIHRPDRYHVRPMSKMRWSHSK